MHYNYFTALHIIFHIRMYSWQKKRQCGDCDGCYQSDDCGKCVNCQDVKKFMGQGIRKQACVLRKCKIQFFCKDPYFTVHPSYIL